MDNSPRWDSAYANVIPGAVPEYQREDNSIITDATQRPTDSEYDRYLWLLEDEGRPLRRRPVAEGDELRGRGRFVSAIFSVACDVLANIGEDYKRPNADVRDLYSWANRFRAGVAESTDQRTGAARDFDHRADRWIVTETAARFAPLLCGGLPHERERALLKDAGRPTILRAPGSSVRGDPVDFACVAGLSAAAGTWRGPVWPVLTWLFSWAFARRGGGTFGVAASRGLRQASDGTFAEYYEPFTGEPLGSMQQSWTAAAVLDWLG